MSIDPAGQSKKSVLERLAYAGAILDQSGPLAVEAEKPGRESFADDIPRSTAESTLPDAADTPRQVDAPEVGRPD
jgi:hypothetical protein